MRALQSCDVTDGFEFDTHPLLLADFKIDVAAKAIARWRLPMSTDLLFDQTILEKQACVATRTRERKFQEALDREDPEVALRQVSLAFEETWKSLSHSGCLFPYISLAGTPKLRQHLSACAELWKYLHKNNGFALKNLRRPWKPPSAAADRRFAMAGASLRRFALASCSVPFSAAMIPFVV